MYDWKRYAFSAHKELGNTNEMRELAIELLMNGRDDEYYEELKLLYQRMNGFLHAKKSWTI